MNNPWLEISYSDYENHMTEIGQAQVLNNLVKYGLEKYMPQRFALLGCATGNGLEHVNSEITAKVYAIDINKKFLDITKKKYEDKIKDLELINSDIQHDKLIFRNIDLFFVGLVLEYAEPEKSLKKIIKTLSKNGVLFIIIQKNKQTSFVTKTNYKSLEKLTVISKEVNENEMDKFIRSENLVLTKRDEIELTKNKSFIVLEYSWLVNESPKYLPPLSMNPDYRSILDMGSERVVADLAVKVLEENPATFRYLLDQCFVEKYPLSMRAARVAQLYCEKYPEEIYPFLDEVIEKSTRSNIGGVRRNFMKIFSEFIDIERIKEPGKLLSTCFDWLLDGNITPAIKIHSMHMIFKLGKNEPDLLNELAATIGIIMDESEISLKTCGRKMLEKISRQSAIGGRQRARG